MASDPEKPLDDRAETCSCFVLQQGRATMSMEMWVLSDRELASVSDWQAAIAAEGYPLQLADGVQLETHGGFLPAHLRGQRTGFECDPYPADEFLQETRQDWP